MIEAIDLTVRRRGRTVLDAVSFDVRPGQVTGVLGGTGSGKSMLLRRMVQLERGGGETLFDGSTYRSLRHPMREVGLLLDPGAGHPDRTVRGQLRLALATDRGAARETVAAPRRASAEGGGEVGARRASGDGAGGVGVARGGGPSGQADSDGREHGSRSATGRQGRLAGKLSLRRRRAARDEAAADQLAAFEAGQDGEFEAERYAECYGESVTGRRGAFAAGRRDEFDTGRRGEFEASRHGEPAVGRRGEFAAGRRGDFAEHAAGNRREGFADKFEASRRGRPADRIDAVLDIVGLTEQSGTRLAELTDGMATRLAIAVALLGDPKALLLDCPERGLEPEGVAWLGALLRAFTSQGRAALVTGSDTETLVGMADRILLLDSGYLVGTRTSEEVLRAPTGAAVIVRSPQIVRFAALLAEAGARSSQGEGACLEVRGMDRARVGDLAYRNGIPVHELSERFTGSDPADLVLAACSGRGRPIVPIQGLPASDGALHKGRGLPEGVYSELVQVGAPRPEHARTRVGGAQSDSGARTEMGVTRLGGAHAQPSGSRSNNVQLIDGPAGGATAESPSGSTTGAAATASASAAEDVLGALTAADVAVRADRAGALDVATVSAVDGVGRAGAASPMDGAGWAGAVSVAGGEGRAEGGDAAAVRVAGAASAGTVPAESAPAEGAAVGSAPAEGAASGVASAEMAETADGATAEAGR